MYNISQKSKVKPTWEVTILRILVTAMSIIDVPNVDNLERSVLSLPNGGYTFSSDGPTMGVIPPFCDPGPRTETDLFARGGVREIKRACEIFGNLGCHPDRCRRMRAHLYACALCHALAQPCSSAPSSRSRSRLATDKERE